MRITLVFVLLLFFIGNKVEAAPATPRPHTGRGLLIIKPGLPQDNSLSGRIILYREPGVGRVADTTAAQLPLLTRIIQQGPGEFPIAVFDKKGSWVKVAYDEGGRSGWLEMERRWSYLSWEELLPGRSFTLLPGLRKEFYDVLVEPAPSSVKAGTLTPTPQLQAKRVRREWLECDLDGRPCGWVRWRDESGRFLITLSSGNAPQNR